MADSTAGLAGQDATPPPSWDVNQYKNWDDLDKVVYELTHNGEGWADLTHNAAAERWYVLEEKLGKAINALGTANASFQQEVSRLKGKFEGVADQAFQELASKVYRQSEDVYNTMYTRRYATTVGNIGHDIQSFAQAWWDLVRDTHNTEDKIRATYKSIIDSAPDTATVNKAENDLKDAYNKAEDALCTKLRELLGHWRDRYELRGGDLSPLHVELPFGGPGTQGGGGSSDSGGSGGQNGQPTVYATPADYGTLQHPLVQRQAGQVTPDIPTLPANTPGMGASGANADFGAGGSGPGAGSSGPGAGGSGPGAGSSGPGAGSSDFGAGGSGPGAGGSGPGAGSSGSGAGGSDPGAAARQKALQDAKKAADGAIDALQNPSAGSGGGSDTGGGSSPGAGSGDSGSPDTSGGGGFPGSTARFGGGSNPGAAARQKALQDAKKAADDAIDGLQSPSDLGSTGSGTGGGPDGGASGLGATDPARQQGLQAAKDAVNKAIDALRKPDDSPERSKALQDAKDAADKAIDALASPSGSDSGQGGGLGTGGGGPDGSGSGAGSPENQKALQDAKDAADKAIDGLIHPDGTGSDGKPSTVSDPNHPGAPSPDAQKALQDAKDAADKAIDGLKNGSGDPSSLSEFLKGTGHPGDPAMGKAEHDAQAAIDKAIESLPGYNGNDAYAQALHQAKDAADHAIEALPDYASVDGGPGQTDLPPTLLSSADPLGGHDGSGFGVGGGSGGGGVPGPDARLDTDVAKATEDLHQVGPDGVQQRAFAGAPAGAVQSSPGMPPMMPPGMGGMGGMGGLGGNKREREPNTWLQADHGTWRDDHDDDEPPSVLGRA